MSAPTTDVQLAAAREALAEHEGALAKVTAAREAVQARVAAAKVDLEILAEQRRPLDPDADRAEFAKLSSEMDGARARMEALATRLRDAEAVEQRAADAVKQAREVVARAEAADLKARALALDQEFGEWFRGVVAPNTQNKLKQLRELVDRVSRAPADRYFSTTWSGVDPSSPSLWEKLDQMLKWLAEEEFARRMPRGRLSTPPSDEGAQLDADLALKQRVAELGKTQTNTPLEYNPFVKGARR